MHRRRWFQIFTAQIGGVSNSQIRPNLICRLETVGDPDLLEAAARFLRHKMATIAVVPHVEDTAPAEMATTIVIEVPVVNITTIELHALLAVVVVEATDRLLVTPWRTILLLLREAVMTTRTVATTPPLLTRTLTVDHHMIAPLGTSLLLAMGLILPGMVVMLGSMTVVGATGKFTSSLLVSCGSL